MHFFQALKVYTDNIDVLYIQNIATQTPYNPHSKDRKASFIKEKEGLP